MLPGHLLAPVAFTSIGNSQPFPSRGIDKLITKILPHTKKYIVFFADLTRNRYNFDSLTLDSY